ncbi:MAG TPA: vanadium-dependent haloperoxidase [Steroidobacteraceae bacterium]|nr:vanadium-dependent haloperoxidase [Steroidobacteraceae bacterium]
MKNTLTASTTLSPGLPRAVASLAGALALAGSGMAKADVIAQFNAVAARTATPTVAVPYPAVTSQEKRTLSFVDLATVHLAMYDAVVAVEGGYAPYAIVPVSPRQGASAAAAAAAAACTVLQGMFPSRAAEYQVDCAPYQPGAATDDATAKGITLGVEVGQRMLAERANDGRDATPDYTPGGGIGDFVPAAPGSNPIWHFAPYMRAFTLFTPAQFRADGPPALTSASYAEAFDEVKRLGRTGGAELTPAQLESARFYTENPNLFWPRATRVFLDRPTLVENARLGALLQVSIGDAILGCFDSKYFFDAWRPRTAISAAAADGNPATNADAGWTPLAPSPNHPEYPSGHSCIAGAVAEVIKSYHGTSQVAFTWNSTVPGTTSHAYGSVQEMLRDMKDARVHGGMHFRFASDDGATLGRRTAQWVVKNYLRPLGGR